MTYFSQFRKSEYSLSQNLQKKVTELSQYTDIVSRAADDASFYTFYNARPDERFDTISNQLYNTPDFYWTIPILNDRITNTWNDSTKSVPALRSYLERKYPDSALIFSSNEEITGRFSVGGYIESTSGSVYRISSIYPSLGYVRGIDVTGSNEITNPTVVNIAEVIPAYKAPSFFTDPDGNRVPSYVENATPTTIEEIETDINDENSRLKVIRPEFIRRFADQFELEMREAAERNNE